MATTPAKKITDGKKGSHHVSMEEDPPYYGDPETLKSAGARADDIPKVERQASVNKDAAQPDMTKDFVAGHDGWPRKVKG
jgi:hypothetical protein